MSGLLGTAAKTQSYTAPMEASLRVQTSAYGMAVPLVYGQTRVTGNLIWYGDFKAIPHTTSTGGGGKGGGGGGSTSTTYTYSASMMLGLCEGTIVGVGRLWKDKDTYANNDLFGIYLGEQGQFPWTYLSVKYPEQALGYSGIAYAAAANYDLGDSSSTPNHSFELTGIVMGSDGGGFATDQPPSFILEDYLTNPRYGVGFPSEFIWNWEAFYNYTVASGFLLSPAFTSQAPAHEFVTLLSKLTNCGFYWSDNALKVTPFGDAEISGNGATYVPNLQPVYALTDEDYIMEGDTDPVVVTRSSTSDAYNRVQIEYINRANQYNVEIAEAKDQANIELYGERPLDPIKAHEICDPEVARKVAQIVLQRALYIRNTYEFVVGVRFALLEPTDYITITDTTLGIVDKPVRILTIEELDDYTYRITAEDAPSGVFDAATYDSPQGSGHQNEFNVPPGNTNAPVIFEPPPAITTSASGLEIWVGASGGDNWGGCQIWVSYDGDTYTQVGSIGTPARQGVLTATFPEHADPDEDNTLAVDLTMSRGQLVSGSRTDADFFTTLCYVGGELVSYQTATLTSAYHYDLTDYIRRGAYGTTIAAHAINEQFLRVDDALAKIPFTVDKLGATIFVKLPAYNVYGTSLQALSDVPAFTYEITGTAINSAPADVSNLLTNYNNFVGGLSVIYWDRINDNRAIDYEVRMGDTWERAQVMRRTPITQFTIPGSGTYWVAARYVSTTGDVYSPHPQSITIEQSTLVNNVLAVDDEHATGWSGTKSTGVVVDGSGNLTFSQSGGLFTTQSGTYEIPTGHVIDAGRVTPCNVLISFAVTGTSSDSNVLTMLNVLTVADFLESSLGPSVLVQPQIAFADASGVYGAWQNFEPGYYNARYFKARLLLSSNDPSIAPIVGAFVFSVDVPDRTDHGSVTTATGGSTVTYSAPFNGGPGGMAVPAVQLTIVDAQPGDDVQLTSPTLADFNVKVVNGGSDVVRTVNWVAQGY